MYCRHCGNELPEGARFCGNCGQETDADFDGSSDNKMESSENSKVRGCIAGVCLLLFNLMYLVFIFGTLIESVKNEDIQTMLLLIIVSVLLTVPNSKAVKKINEMLK